MAPAVLPVAVCVGPGPLFRVVLAFSFHVLAGIIAGNLSVCSSNAQCKDEASEQTGFERHGNADTLGLS